jgi:ketosteroid isomerase-like protein
VYVRPRVGVQFIGADDFRSPDRLTLWSGCLAHPFRRFGCTAIPFLSQHPDLRDTARAMSQQNVEIVKALQPTQVDLVEVFASDEVARTLLSAFSAVLSEEFVVQFTSSEMRLPEYHGVDGFLTAWADWLAPWASYWIETEEFIDAGDEVVVLVHIRARTARDAVAVEHSPAAVWTLRDQKVVALRFYLDRTEALEAVGLSEQDAHADS